MSHTPVIREPRRFHDGGPVGGQPDPGAEPRVVLQRHVDAGVESFEMRRAIGYRDRRLGELVVPAASAFRTDLTSVPWLFTWLVPRTGAHLPAALLHDGLVGGADRERSYRSTEGHEVSREAADRVFRDAMADTGTGVVRRWVVWAAVATATVFVGSAGWSGVRWTRYRAAAVTTVAVVLVIGTLATLDLFDVAALLPWMGERPWWSELIGGLGAAVAIPVLLGLTWGRFRVAGAILGVLLALLLHVTLALLLLTGVYQAVEAFAGRAPRLALGLAAAGVAAAVGVTLGYAWA
jgi:hypothetical protein